MELIFELVIQTVGEVLVEIGFRRLGRFLTSRAGRVVLRVVALVVAFSGGFWWGTALTEVGETAPPRALWVSVGLMLAFLVLAVARPSDEPADDPGTDGVVERFADALRPWTWTRSRLLGFASLNGCVAAGIALGFTPLTA